MATILFLACCTSLVQGQTVSDGVRDPNGIIVHTVQCDQQEGPTKIRVLLPDKMEPGKKYPVVYVLPVEAKDENRYGDGLTEIKKHDLHNRHGVICVAMTFGHLPWFADHPTDPKIRQEEYVLKVVLPFIEKTYPARSEQAYRWLLGFSKSGWGAFTLLLRNPGVFGKAVAWDAPLMMTRPDRYGMGPIFGTQENFEKYQISKLLAKLDDKSKARLAMVGHSNFKQHHDDAHALLQKLDIPHEHRDVATPPHTWHSGWVAVGMRWLAGE